MALRSHQFTKLQRLAQAGRVGFMCSNPSCRRLTIGPHSDPGKILELGSLAHISSVTPCGPRYDKALSEQMKKSTENTIWLCLYCHQLVDTCIKEFSANVLRDWKTRAESYALDCMTQTTEEVSLDAIKKRCKDLLRSCESATSSGEKGKSLEDLMKILFTAGGGLICESQRRNTGDEEIDLVLRNHVNRPFWFALNSALIFVECKNWRSPVGSKEIRDFEIKMQNHPLAKVGFFVGLNGFSSEVNAELKRMGRSSYHLVLIDKDDVGSYLTSDESLLDWLEKHISKLH